MGWIAGSYLIYLLLPIVLLAIGSVGRVWTNTLLPRGLTGQWYLEVVRDPSFQWAFWSSLKVVGATCILDVLLGLPMAYAIYSTAHRGVQVAARVIFLLPIAVPELVLAFGFILIFSSNILPWLGSIWVLIAAHVVLTLPYLLHALIADMSHLNLFEAELAAETLGAGFMSRFLDIVVPSVRHSLFSSLITVAAISIGEFQLSNLVSGFMTRTYPVVLLQAFYGATGFACAATVVLLILAVIASALGAVTAGMTHLQQERRS
jgi:putative spermidine/putrescine transport system permease protein